MSRINTQFKKGLIPWNKGKKASLELRKKLSIAHLGVKLSPETCRRMSVSRTGMVMSKEAVAKSLAGRMKNIKEIGRKISLARMGHPVSQETKDKISQKMKGQGAWNIGRKASMKTLEKLRISHLGQKQSESSKAAKRLLCGDKASNWQGGITPINKRIRNSLEYKQWRKKVFERDNHTCQICGAHGVGLHADHFPIAFSIILNEIKRLYGMEGIYDMAMRYPKMWDINNARTLCIPCHEKTENYLWKSRMKTPCL